MTEPAPQPPSPPPPPVGTTPMPPPTDAAGKPVGPQRAVTLRRTAAVERAAIALVTVSAIFGVLSIPVGRSVRGDAQAYLDGLSTDDDLIEQLAPALLTGVVQGLAVLAAAVLVIIWMYRIAANHRDLGRDTRWGPGWAIGGWFAPPLLFIIPFLVFSEMWKAADAETPQGHNGWRDTAASPLVPIWFVLYSLAPLALIVWSGGSGLTGLGGSEEQLAEQFADGSGGAVASAAIAAAGAVAFVAMARALGARHRRFTGEDRA